MKRTGYGLLVTAVALFAPPVFAQTPPAPAPPAEPPTPPPGDAPMPVQTTPQPTGVGEHGPEKKLRIDEDEDEVETEPEVQWGVGARSYFTFLPASVIELFVEHATSMNSASFAASVIRRKGNFDIEFNIEYGNYSPENGLYEENGEDPSQQDQYPDLTIFNNLGMISGDASFIWHADLTDFMQFRYGAGIGVGVKTGSATQQDTMCDSATTIDDLDDINACQPVPGAPIDEMDIPPVLPVVKLLAGFRFKIVDQLSLNIEAGFRFPAFFAGGGIGYFF
jgi:hypothetical protein